MTKYKSYKQRLREDLQRRKVILKSIRQTYGYKSERYCIAKSYIKKTEFFIKNGIIEGDNSIQSPVEINADNEY